MGPIDHIKKHFNSDDSDESGIRSVIPTRWNLFLVGVIVLFAMALAKTYFKSNIPPKNFWTDAFLLFGAEIGVALIVAFFVGFFIERDAKRAELALKERESEHARIRAEVQEKAAEERSRLIANNVI
jgi:hypothetical protein